MSASFDEKVEALRRLREKRLAKQGKEAQQEKELANDANDAVPAAKPASEAEGDKSRAGLLESRETRADPAGPGGVAEADALFCAGHCHERGLHGCSVDLGAAAELYTLAAEQGHAVAQWRLGELCESGQHGQVPEDAQQALHWYTKSSEAGNAQAQSALALMLEDGREGVPPDDAAALRWHLAASEQGHALSQYCAACLLADGRGAERDAGAAEMWLRKSAAQGFGPARKTLEEARLGPPVEAWTSGAPEEDSEQGLLGLAQRIARQLGDLDEDEAGILLDELLADVPSLLDPRAGDEDGGDEVVPGLHDHEAEPSDEDDDSDDAGT